jgi:hypothetical protein
MLKKINFRSGCILMIGIITLLSESQIYAQNKVNVVTLNWNNIIAVSKMTPTLQIVENPMVRNNSPIHKATFKALKELEADYIRYVPWFPYPKLAVAELDPPEKDKTSWNFTYLDSTMEAFMEATKGHPVVINFSTTPAWIWKTDSVVTYPADPYKTCWTYNQGTQLRDTTMKEVSDYFTRLFSWYTQGGFTDELGKFHKSEHFYKIPYWEVLNEPDLEHNISPRIYTKMYDAIVSKLKKLSPDTKFVGLSLSRVRNPEYFEYFLNPKNHQPGIPLDGISYHHYSQPSWTWNDQPMEVYQYTYFEKAEAFFDRVRYIENIRKRLSPNTITMINEIGTMTHAPKDGIYNIPDNYWNLSGSLYAYIYLELTKIGIEVAGESQMVGYPTQFPDVSMMNWKNGNPNARFWILKLLKDNFGPGDKLVNATYNNALGVYVQGFITKKGKKLLLINKKNIETPLQLPDEAKNAQISFVDITTGEKPPMKSQLTGNSITLRPYAVAVVLLKE